MLSRPGRIGTLDSLRVGVGVLMMSACSVSAHAQDGGDVVSLTAPTTSDQVIGQPAGPPPTPRHTGIKAMLKGLVIDFKYLPSRENLLWAGVGGGLALAVHPLDDNVNRALVGSSVAD